MKLLALARGDRSSINVDKENRIIKDVILASVGEAKGWGFSIEEQFLTDMVAFTRNKLHNKVKCYYGHSYNNLGSRIATIKNIRKDGLVVIGDIHMMSAADASPNNPGAASYVMEMAAEDETSVMMSIKFRESMYYQYSAPGQKFKVYYYDKSGAWVRPIKEFGKLYVGFKELKSCDVVDEGGLTDKMFSADRYLQFNEIINSPDFEQYLRNHYKELTPLNKFYEELNHSDSTVVNIFKKINQLMSKESNTTALEEKLDALTNDLNEANELILGLRARLELAEANSGEGADTTALQERLDDYEDKIKALNTKIEELSAGAASDATDTDGDGEDAIPLWLRDPVNQRAQKIYTPR